MTRRRGRLLRRRPVRQRGLVRWATQEELQPNIDGLSFDEVLLLGLVPGILTLLVTRYVTRRSRRHQTDITLHRPADRRY
jgi:hypothetical protein